MSSPEQPPLYTLVPLVNGGQQVLRAVLAQMGLTASDVARHCGTTPQGTGNWLTGASKPNAESRAKLAESPYCIDPSWWDDLPYVPDTPQPAEPVNSYETPDYSAPGVARKLLIEQVDRVRRQRHDAAARGFTDAKTVARLEKAETEILKILGTATGELSRSEETKLIRSNTWIRLKNAVVEALRPHPEALRDVIEALKRNDAG